MMKECIWPKLDIKIGTNKEGADMIADNSMGAFDWYILMRGTGSSWMHFIVVICKNV